jgi:hypothetical protein
MRCSGELPCAAVRSPLARLIARLWGLAWVSRNHFETLSLPSTISAAAAQRT